MNLTKINWKEWKLFMFGAIDHISHRIKHQVTFQWAQWELRPRPGPFEPSFILCLTISIRKRILHTFSLLSSPPSLRAQEWWHRLFRRPLLAPLLLRGPKRRRFTCCLIGNQLHLPFFLKFISQFFFFWVKVFMWLESFFKQTNKYICRSSNKAVVSVLSPSSSGYYSSNVGNVSAHLLISSFLRLDSILLLFLWQFWFLETLYPKIQLDHCL